MMNQDSKTDCEIAWQGKFIHVCRRGRWEYVVRNTARPAVGIVAMHNDGRVVLVEQFRPPLGKSLIELPAGLAGDIQGEEDELLVVAAQRELLEETGYSAKHWQSLCSGFSSPGLTDESVHLFLARDLSKTSAGGGTEHESIQIHEIAMDQILDWLAARGQSVDIKLLAGLFAAQQALRS